MMMNNKSYFLVDACNVIHQWKQTPKYQSKDFDSIKESLISLLSEYQALRGEGTAVILVFDGQPLDEMKSQCGLVLLYSGKDHSADELIAELVTQYTKTSPVTVVSSDAMIQTQILGSGAQRFSARELSEEIQRVMDRTKNLIKHRAPQSFSKRLDDHLSQTVRKKLRAMMMRKT